MAPEHGRLLWGLSTPTSQVLEMPPHWRQQCPHPMTQPCLASAGFYFQDWGSRRIYWWVGEGGREAG